MGVTFSQLFPPAASLTEENLPSQAGKVFIVTGGASGVGLGVTTILYRAGAKVYIAGRSEEKAMQAIKMIELQSAESKVSGGELAFLMLVLDDLSSIKASAETFKSQELRLDALFNNAGVALPPKGSISKQGHELQMGTNCLGPFLFTQCLLPVLESTAKTAIPGTVRVIWTSSQLVELSGPKDGMNLDHLLSIPKDQKLNYINSKLGNEHLALELARQVGDKGILSIAQNPGNLKTNVLRHARFLQIASFPVLHKAKMGAYTEIWAAFSPELDLKKASNGAYVIPWGRLHPSRRGRGKTQAEAFRRWCEDKTAEYA